MYTGQGGAAYAELPAFGTVLRIMLYLKILCIMYYEIKCQSNLNLTDISFDPFLIHFRPLKKHFLMCVFHKGGHQFLQHWVYCPLRK